MADRDVIFWLGAVGAVNGLFEVGQSEEERPGPSGVAGPAPPPRPPPTEETSPERSSSDGSGRLMPVEPPSVGVTTPVDPEDISGMLERAVREERARGGTVETLEELLGGAEEPVVGAEQQAPSEGDTLRDIIQGSLLPPPVSPDVPLVEGMTGDDMVKYIVQSANAVLQKVNPPQFAYPVVAADGTVGTASTGSFDLAVAQAGALRSVEGICAVCGQSHPPDKHVGMLLRLVPSNIQEPSIRNYYTLTAPTAERDFWDINGRLHKMAAGPIDWLAYTLYDFYTPAPNNPNQWLCTRCATPTDTTFTARARMQVVNLLQRMRDSTWLPVARRDVSVSTENLFYHMHALHQGELIYYLAKDLLPRQVAAPFRMGYQDVIDKFTVMDKARTGFYSRRGDYWQILGQPGAADAGIIDKFYDGWLAGSSELVDQWLTIYPRGKPLWKGPRVMYQRIRYRNGWTSNVTPDRKADADKSSRDRGGHQPPTRIPAATARPQLPVGVTLLQGPAAPPQGEKRPREEEPVAGPSTAPAPLTAVPWNKLLQRVWLGPPRQAPKVMAAAANPENVFGDVLAQDDEFVVVHGGIRQLTDEGQAERLLYELLVRKAVMDGTVFGRCVSISGVRRGGSIILYLVLWKNREEAAAKPAVGMVPERELGRRMITVNQSIPNIERSVALMRYLGVYPSWRPGDVRLSQTGIFVELPERLQYAGNIQNMLALINIVIAGTSVRPVYTPQQQQLFQATPGLVDNLKRLSDVVNSPAPPIPPAPPVLQKPSVLVTLNGEAPAFSVVDVPPDVRDVNVKDMVRQLFPPPTV